MDGLVYRFSRDPLDFGGVVVCQVSPLQLSAIIFIVCLALTKSAVANHELLRY